MGLIAELQQRNAELEKRVAHLELAFEGVEAALQYVDGLETENGNRIKFAAHFGRKY